jgi:hypothetical protein
MVELDRWGSARVSGKGYPPAGGWDDALKGDSSTDVAGVNEWTFDRGPEVTEEYVVRSFDETVEGAYCDSRAAASSAALSSFSLRRSRWKAERFMSCS